MLCGEVQNVGLQTAYKYTHFCPAGNHLGALKVAQSVNKKGEVVVGGWY